MKYIYDDLKDYVEVSLRKLDRGFYNGFIDIVDHWTTRDVLGRILVKNERTCKFFVVTKRAGGPNFIDDNNGKGYKCIATK